MFTGATPLTFELLTEWHWISLVKTEPKFIIQLSKKNLANPSGQEQRSMAFSQHRNSEFSVLFSSPDR